MELYTLGAGTINGIDYKDNQFVLTTEGNKVRIRLQGESTPFIETDLANLLDSSNAEFATMAAFVTYWNANFATGATPTSDITLPLDVMSSSHGEKIITGIGPHAVSCRGFVSRIDDCVVVSITVNGVVYTGAGLAPYFPNGNKFYKTEMFLFAETEVCTSITMTLATDSLTTIKA